MSEESATPDRLDFEPLHAPSGEGAPSGMQKLVKGYDEPERRYEPGQDLGKAPHLPVEERGETVRLPGEGPETQRRRRRMRATPTPARLIANTASPASLRVGTGVGCWMPA